VRNDHAVGPCSSYIEGTRGLGEERAMSGRTGAAEVKPLADDTLLGQGGLDCLHVPLNPATKPTRRGKQQDRAAGRARGSAWVLTGLFSRAEYGRRHRGRTGHLRS
jgi:hypothetical protein